MLKLVHSMRRRLAVLLGVLLSTAVLVGVPLPASASVLPTTADGMWQTDGLVNATVYSPDGSTLYLGGTFDFMCPPAQASCTGAGPNDIAVDNLAAIDSATGEPVTWFRPQPDGEVRALAVAPNGVLYLGGAFNVVGGQNHRKLAAVQTSDGAAIAAWKPVVSSVVKALALSPDSGTVYAGGVFTAADGAPRGRLAAYTAYSTATPAQKLLPWAPEPTGTNTYDKGSLMPTTVNSLVVRPDGQVYAGGVFLTIGAAARENVAALEGATATATGLAVPGFALNPGLSYVVLNLTLTRDGTTLFANGRGPGGFAWGIDSATGARLWARKFDGDVQAAVATDTLLYVGGHFDFITVAGSKLRDERHHLAALDASTGRSEAWNPRLDSTHGVFGMAWTPGRVAAVGDFTQVQYAAHQGVGQFTGGDVVAPAPVSTITATSTARGRVDVSWSPVADADSPTLSYRVFRRTLGGPWSPVDTVSGPSAGTSNVPLGLADTAVVVGTAYEYAVRAADQVFLTPIGAVAGPVTVVGDQSPPAVPTGLTAESPSPGVVTLSWNASADADDPSVTYTLWRTLDSATTAAATFVGPSSGVVTYRDSVTAAGTYTYTVTASDGTFTSELSEASAPVTVVSDPTVPSVPSNVVATSTAAGTVTLSWTASTDPEQGSAGLSYVVSRRQASQGGTGSVIATTALGQTTFFDSTETASPVIADKSYAYYVQAKDGPNTSAKSLPVTVTVSSAIFADDMSSLSAWTLPATKSGVTHDPTKGYAAPGSAHLVGQLNPKLYGSLRRSLGGSYRDVCVKAAVAVTGYDTRNNAETSLIRLLSTSNADIGRVFLDRKGVLWLRSDWASTPTRTNLTVAAADGSWHHVQVCVHASTPNGDDGTLTAWWDGVKYGPITGLDTSPDRLGNVEVGERNLAAYVLDVDDVTAGITTR